MRVLSTEVSYSVRRGAAEAVDTPHARTARGDVKKNKAVQNRGVTQITSGPGSLRLMSQEIRHRHRAAGNKCGKTGKKSDTDEHSRQEFDNAGSHNQRIGRRRRHCGRPGRVTE